MPSPSTPASTSASATTGVSSSRWARLAISGTTPPKRACRSTWLDTTDDRTVRPPHTRAAAVSSHDVSMPRMGASENEEAVTVRAYRRSSGAAVGQLGDDAVDAGLIRVVIDAMDPHDDGVLAGLGVVAGPHAIRLEAESAVEVLGSGVGSTHL